MNDIDDIYKNIEEYNPNKKRKILIVFDGTIASIFGGKIRDPIVTVLFIRRRKLNISLVFVTVLFCCSKSFPVNFNNLFCYKNSKQKRTEKNCI